MVTYAITQLRVKTRELLQLLPFGHNFCNVKCVISIHLKAMIILAVMNSYQCPVGFGCTHCDNSGQE